MMIKKILYAALLLTIILLTGGAVISCGGVELSAPTDLTAKDPDPDNPNRIELSWKPVSGADIYYVYRDTTAAGTFSTNAGFSVTKYTTDAGDVRYSFMETFDEGEGGTYFYGVTAADNSDISIESAMSSTVEASTYSGTWSSADPAVLGTAAQLSLAAAANALYAVYAPTGSAAALSAKKYAVDEDSDADEPPKIWTSLTGSPGVTDSTVTAPAFAGLVTGGELYVAFADADPAAGGKVTMKYYHDSGTADVPSFAWTTAGAAGFNDAAAANVAMVSVGFGGDIYSAFLEGQALQMYKNNVEIDLVPSIVPAATLSISLLNHNNAIYLGYEDVSSLGLYLREFDTTFETLGAGGLVSSADIDDGNAVFVSGGGDLYAVYIAVGGGLSVKKLVGSSWTDLDDVAGDTPPVAADSSPAGTLAAHWFNGYLYVFYVDSSIAGGNRGWVKYYSESDGWQNAQRNGGGALTGTTDLGSFQLKSAGTELYAGYIDGGNAYVRILK